VWTGIRSYLKGSIEAVQKGDLLTEVEFWTRPSWKKALSF
jgi:hypothetical protein